MTTKNKKPAEGQSAGNGTDNNAPLSSANHYSPSPKILQMHSDLALYFLAQALVELAGPIGGRNTDFSLAFWLYVKQLSIIETLESSR